MPAHEVHKVADKFIELANSLGGQLLKREYWGLRTLAYIVKKNRKGHYVMLGLKCSPETVKEIERNYKINEDIIKFITIKVDKIEEAPSPMMQAPSDFGSLEDSAVE